MSASDVGFARTAAGLLIPAQTLDRLTKTMVESDFVKLSRLLKLAKTHGMRAMFFCDTCNQPIRMNHHEQIVTADDTKDRSQPGGGRLSLECGCRTWMVR